MPVPQVKTIPGPRKGDDFFGVKKLIRAIQDSALSEGKKLAYLYLIVSGAFSTDTFTGLKEDMVAAGKTLQQKISKLEREKASADAQIATLEKEINALEPLALKELKDNLDRYVAAVAKETEASRSGSQEKAIKKIKTKLSKET